MKETVAGLIEEALATLIAERALDQEVGPVQVERSRDAAHGDLASNVALANSKRFSMRPRDLAEAICAALEKYRSYFR